MIYIDTETTGLIKNAALALSMQPKIIELGAIRIEDGQPPTFFSQLLNPGIKLEPIITKVTGLTDDDLADKPKFADVVEDFADFCRGEKVWVAHNMPFDKQMLVFELRRLGLGCQFPYPSEYIDTIQMAKPLYNGKWMKLSALYEDFFPGEYEQKHRALEDCKDLQRVHNELIHRLKAGK